jgi:hypothetical protein
MKLLVAHEPAVAARREPMTHGGRAGYAPTGLTLARGRGRRAGPLDGRRWRRPWAALARGIEGEVPDRSTPGVGVTRGV